MKKEKKHITSYRFVRPSSFITGIGSVLAITGHYHNIIIAGPEEDAKAIESDWSVVGYGILKAKEELEKCA